jgi:hypothetical protein
MCKTCFEEHHLPAQCLAERCDAFTVSLIREPVLKAVVAFTCSHDRTHRHSVYPGTEDWTWCEFVTDDWRYAEIISSVCKAA